MDEDERRLGVIVFTDVVGYTKLTQEDEKGALQLLNIHNDLIRTLLPKYRGREVKTIGDSFLIEFGSTLDAINCAIAMQKAFAERNMTVGDSERIQIRIGMHVGDVVHRGKDVFGDAVNITSRIEHFAKPGEICISEQIYSQIRNKIPFEFTKMPEQILKNVDLPMDLYTLSLSSPKSSEDLKNPKTRIAVLPFVNISPDEKDEYFADGLTDELISGLSQIKGLRVIARTSMNHYRNTNTGIAQIANELNVGSVLEGSVRKFGNKVRVTAQLIDVRTQEHVWSAKYDRELDDVFLIQSDIASNVADTLKVKLLENEHERIEKKGTENLSAYVAYLKGRALLHDRSEKAIKGAREQFELAIKEDPKYANAYSGLADIQILMGDYLLAPVPDSLAEAKTYIKKALELDPDLAEAHVSLAQALRYDYRFADAQNEFRKAIALNPSYATAHHWYSSCLGDLGESKEACSEIMLAEELDPLSSVVCLSAIYTCIGMGMEVEASSRLRKLSEIDPASPLVLEGYMAYHFARKEWDKALVYLDKMRESDPEDPYIIADIAYIYAVTNRQDEALKLIEKISAIPESSGTKYSLLTFVYSGLGDLDACFDCLEKAFSTREIFFGWFRQYPLFQNVRDDPRFDALLRRAKLID